MRMNKDIINNSGINTWHVKSERVLDEFVNISQFHSILPDFPASHGWPHGSAMVAWELKSCKHDFPCFALLSLSFCWWACHYMASASLWSSGSAVPAVSPSTLLTPSLPAGKGQGQDRAVARRESLDTVKELLTICQEIPVLWTLLPPQFMWRN